MFGNSGGIMRAFLIAALSVATLMAQAPAKDVKKKEAPKPAAAAKTETKTSAKAEAKPTATALVGNKDSKTFHKAGCSAAAKIKDANKTTFATQAEAEKAGFKACKVCFK